MRSAASVVVRSLVVLWIGAASALGGCGGTAATSEGVVTLEVDLERAGRWSATGEPVERGAFCAAGIRAVLHAADAATGEALRMRDEVRIMWETIERPISPPVVWTVEHTCADGSGSFVTEENWARGTWTVLSGTGTYRSLHGDGELTFTTPHYTQVRPRGLSVTARVAGLTAR